MPTLEDDLKIIQNAVYGNEMRTAISDALSQGWAAVTIMMNSVDNLNERVDSLYDGSGGTTDNPDRPTGTGCYVVGDTIPAVEGLITHIVSVGDAEIF